jgi:fibronectin type 3 domain-containing protein
MISLDGTAWVAMGATYGLNYNWNLAGYVAPSDGGTAPAKPMVKSFTGTPSVSSFASAKESGVGGNISVKFNPSEIKSLTGYKVYRKNPGSTTFNVIGTPTETYYSDNVTITGIYQYYVTAVYTNPNGESNPTNTITVDVLTGIEDVLSNSTVIYPNPASSVVNIKSDYPVNTIKVYNYSGQVVASEQADSKFYQFNTSRFTPGLYLFQIETAEGTITRRIIIE